MSCQPKTCAADDAGGTEQHPGDVEMYAVMQILRLIAEGDPVVHKVFEVVDIFRCFSVFFGVFLPKSVYSVGLEEQGGLLYNVNHPEL